MRIVIRALLTLFFAIMASAAQAGSYWPRQGDTLSALARHVRSDVPCLMSLNKGVITDANRIYVGKPIELGRCDKSERKAAAIKPDSQAIVSSDLVWLPSQVMPCADCAPEALIAQRFPEDVALSLISLVAEGEGEPIAIDRGERFALLQISHDETRSAARVMWQVGERRTAMRYALKSRGMEYVLIRHEFGGWAIKDPTPDNVALARIRDELYVLAGDDGGRDAGAIELIARLIWWRRMTQGFPDLDRPKVKALWVTAGLPGNPLLIP